MTIHYRWGRVGLLLAMPIAACSTIVGADFDGLGPIASAGTSAGSSAGGAAGSSAGGTAGGSASGSSAGGTGATAGSAPAGGAGGDPAITQAGSSTGGSSSGGMAGESAGGAPTDGGAPTLGGAGNGGESAGGAGGSPDVGVPPDAIVLNELKAQGAEDDYIELYNPGSETADLSGCYVADDSSQNRVTFPHGATIAPHGFVVVRLQQAVSTGTVTTCWGYTPCYDGVTWGISAKGEPIFLHDSQGVLLDQLLYPSEDGPNNVGDGFSFGRIPDGGNSAGRIFKSAGATNNAVP
jgi:Lamin Tail Domain